MSSRSPCIVYMCISIIRHIITTTMLNRPPHTYHILMEYYNNNNACNNISTCTGKRAVSYMYITQVPPILYQRRIQRFFIIIIFYPVHDAQPLSATTKTMRPVRTMERENKKAYGGGRFGRKSILRVRIPLCVASCNYIYIYTYILAYIVYT